MLRQGLFGLVACNLALQIIRDDLEQFQDVKFFLADLVLDTAFKFDITSDSIEVEKKPHFFRREPSFVKHASFQLQVLNRATFLLLAIPNILPFPHVFDR